MKIILLGHCRSVIFVVAVGYQWIFATFYLCAVSMHSLFEVRRGELIFETNEKPKSRSLATGLAMQLPTFHSQQ